MSDKISRTLLNPARLDLGFRRFQVRRKFAKSIVGEGFRKLKR
jgi:hypothetical protein